MVRGCGNWQEQEIEGEGERKRILAIGRESTFAEMRFFRRRLAKEMMEIEQIGKVK